MSRPAFTIYIFFLYDNADLNYITTENEITVAGLIQVQYLQHKYFVQCNKKIFWAKPAVYTSIDNHIHIF